MLPISSVNVSSYLQNPEMLQMSGLGGNSTASAVSGTDNLPALNSLGGGVGGVGFDSGAMTQAMNSALSAAQGAGSGGAINVTPDSTVSPINAPGGGTGTFVQALQNAVEEVNGKMQAADSAKTGLLTGETTNVHQAMIAMQESNIALSLMVEVRNKLVDSYQELMRMQV